MRVSDQIRLSSCAVLPGRVVALRVCGRGRSESLSTAVACLGCRLTLAAEAAKAASGVRQRLAALMTDTTSRQPYRCAGFSNRRSGLEMTEKGWRKRRAVNCVGARCRQPINPLTPGLLQLAHGSSHQGHRGTGRHQTPASRPQSLTGTAWRWQTEYHSPPALVVALILRKSQSDNSVPRRYLRQHPDFSDTPAAQNVQSRKNCCVTPVRADAGASR